MCSTHCAVLHPNLSTISLGRCHMQEKTPAQALLSAIGPLLCGASGPQLHLQATSMQTLRTLLWPNLGEALARVVYMEFESAGSSQLAQLPNLRSAKVHYLQLTGPVR